MHVALSQLIWAGLWFLSGQICGVVAQIVVAQIIRFPLCDVTEPGVCTCQRAFAASVSLP